MNKYCTAKEKMLNSKYAILIVLFNFVVDSKLPQPLSATLASQRKSVGRFEANNLIH